MRTPPKGRLVRISLEAVPLTIRLRAAERLEAKLWHDYDPLDAVDAAAKIRKAALAPRGTYVLSEAAVVRVLGAVP